MDNEIKKKCQKTHQKLVRTNIWWCTGLPLLYYTILSNAWEKYRAFIIDINLLYSRSYYKYKIFTL